MAEINLSRARKIIRGIFAEGREKELKPLSVVGLDTGGNVKAFEREDGAAPGRFAVAHGKAYGTIMLGMAGTAQMARAEQQAYFMTAVNGLYGGQVVQEQTPPPARRVVFLLRNARYLSGVATK